MNLREAAEMALEFASWFTRNDHSIRPKHKAPEVVEALRQALAMEKFSKVNQEIEEALKQPEQEPVGYVTIENISSWAQVPSIKWFKKPTEGPLYTAPVDAVNMSQERVDETAKREQEPVAWVYNGILHEFDPSEFATSEVTPLYTAPPKREWVGLEDEDVATVKNEFNRGALWAEQILKEKNT